ncbi:hypothetical protein PFY12_07825 [Chryseobacterium camelliae]|uniref:VCBS repeat-containing protein n=1 Tax=Chryseobacterium camelliae TaxID=1265445 RepID=A0ABY7QQV8_9FLAO|nr:hypothetical protein [Chryseobacterium camelliae]WBV62017.1 hypothetical protein PFY12_07825 [Chryseobacterium camelliae]
MKLVLSFFSFIIFTMFQSQELKDFVIPKGYEKVLEVKGDLDKDGKEEMVIVCNTFEKIENQGYKRKFYVLKKIQGSLKIWKENSTILNSSGAGFYPEDNKLEIQIKNNCLIISQSFYSNSRHTDTGKYTFRFQNGDFYLIGAFNQFEDTCEFNFVNDVNFSTGKVIIDETYSECDGDENRKIPQDYHKEFIHKFSALIKMNEFRIGENKFKIPGSKKYFVY